ncbi:sodium:solute symporter family protein [Ralstonia pseudosolanacearum]|uniref:sodium:solute symporter family protein n=1 Tax=Ralstonia pseudosolanacearum TaxID=1310165 RepID=UPI00035B6623|nr:sodium:solute symporter family protein [Ralstonia pseudosolanacearum]AOE89873.1 putative symporter [Ralstonia solanacearum]ESS49233.1 putative Na+/solute symporter [Ralstonia solanacearum SD54]AXV69740.1 cation acetate symporter [Ralstonia solanacearum]AXV95491.1 cation acetate symporter [Ralstonia solanacearum]AXW00726.1 cation acetate symporter [Ralstonia solanacearum]
MAATDAATDSRFRRRLFVYYGLYTAGLLLFIVMMGAIERVRGPGVWLGYVFLFVTIAIYACIGLICRTADLTEYYVAGRRVPAFFNGMATAADWMSAASFIGLAGIVFASGYEGLAYVMGWTGGYCLVAFLLAPYLRKFGGYTVPDFLATRYGNGERGGSAVVRGIAVLGATLCSFVYLVAQIQGVGLVVTRFIGVEFSVGVFFGLAGILVCSFLGGMRAVTWTQVAQYIILIVSFLGVVAMIGWHRHHDPVPQLSTGRLLLQIEAAERRIAQDPAEQAVRERFLADAQALQERIARLPQSFDETREALNAQLKRAREHNAPLREIKALERAREAFPPDAAAAGILWNQQREEALAHSRVAPPSTEPFPSASEAERGRQRLNFVLLVFCLMVGTASLPHILTRFHTTPSVRETRNSVGWTLFFIVLLYVSAPALAALVKLDLLLHLVGTSFADLPQWIVPWRKVDPPVFALHDINGDGIVQWAEVMIQPDMIVLAAPEIAGLPYVMSGLIAAGALAAALSTADGLLLTIANALSHDVYFHMIDNNASHQRRVTGAKVVLLGVALLAAYVTSLKPGNILFLVGAAFSLAASCFFPVLVLGVFWKRTNRAGAIAGMLTGLAVSVYYIFVNYPFFTRMTGILGRPWFGVDPIASGAFGVPAGFAAAVIVSLLTRPNRPVVDRLVGYLRDPL